MSARMANPVMIVPDALQAMLGLSKVTGQVGVPQETTELIHLRVSQLNGCAPCIYMHSRDLGKSKESDERMLMVSAWREAPCFNDAERAALGLAEAVTRLSDRPDPVPDDVWDEAVRHYSEQELGALIIGIGLVNLWNRINVSTRQAPAAGWS